MVGSIMVSFTTGIQISNKHQIRWKATGSFGNNAMAVTSGAFKALWNSSIAPADIDTIIALIRKSTTVGQLNEDIFKAVCETIWVRIEHEYGFLLFSFFVCILIIDHFIVFCIRLCSASMEIQQYHSEREAFTLFLFLKVMWLRQWKGRERRSRSSPARRSTAQLELTCATLKACGLPPITLSSSIVRKVIARIRRSGCCPRLCWKQSGCTLSTRSTTSSSHLVLQAWSSTESESSHWDRQEIGFEPISDALYGWGLKNNHRYLHKVVMVVQRIRGLQNYMRYYMSVEV